MICSTHVRITALMLSIALFPSFASASVPGAPGAVDRIAQGTVVTLRWGARPGGSRYRLQLANNAEFSDIVFDRVVSGHEYQIADLAPGRYFWRVAALGANLGEFSSAGVIEVQQGATPTTSVPTLPRAETATTNPPAISTRGGWFAAVGNVTKSVLARLRSPNRLDVVALTNDGRVIAIDATSGIALWSSRTPMQSLKAAAPMTFASPLPIRTSNGLDNIVLFSANVVTMIDGPSGREVWRGQLPGVATGAVVSGARIFALDNSLMTLFVIDGNTGKLISDARLPRRAMGMPTPLVRHGVRAVMVALEDGQLQLFDQTAKQILTGNAGSVAMTAPLLVKTTHGELVLVGTSNGLTALDAEDLRPLGRVTLKGDAPRGTLLAQDLDGDGISEVVMFSARGRVVVVKSDEGKILWEADAKYADAAAFADIDGDHVLDLLMAGRENYAFALSGRDGAMIWKAEGPAGVATNHTTATMPRSTFVVPSNSGVLLIAVEANGGGLRAVEFPKLASSPN